MKFIGVRELRGALTRLRRLEESEEIILTANGKPWALLSPVDEDSLDEQLEALRRARSLLALEKAQRAAAKKGAERLSDADIAREIQAARRARR